MVMGRRGVFEQGDYVLYVRYGRASALMEHCEGARAVRGGV